MLTAAIIGCGRIAGGYDRTPVSDWAFTHAGAYRLCARTTLIAAADIDVDRLRAFGAKWGVETLYQDYDEMLDRERPDLVSICLPPDAHLAALRSACRINARGVWLEKPVAASLADARVASELGAGRPVSVNYFRRWNPSLVALKDEIERGALGRPRRATVHYVKGLLGNGSHFVDLLRWLFGEPVGVRTLRVHDTPADDPGVDFELLFGGGLAAAVLHIPHTTYVLHEVDLFFDGARVVIGQRGQELTRFEAIEEPHYGGFTILRRGATAETDWRAAAAHAVNELADCVERGGTPACTLRDGLRTLELCVEARDGRSIAALRENRA